MARKATRSAQGQGTIRKKTVNGKTYWEGRITVGRDLQGRQKQKSFSGKTQQEVLQKMAQAQAEVNEGNYLEPSKITLKVWLEQWQSLYFSSLKPGTAANYKQYINQHITPSIGNIKLCKLTAVVMQEWYNGLHNQRFEDKELSAKTRENIYLCLHTALEAAVEADMLRANPADKIKLQKVIKKDVKVLDSDAQERFYKEIDGHKYQNLFTLALNTGMRESEILGLQWECVDFSNSEYTGFH